MRRTVRARRGQQGITLIELLVSLIVLSILTTMILVTWFALSRSYSYSITSNNARDYAREAVARLEREVRDAQADNATAEAALIRARPRSIVVATTFNRSDSHNPTTTPYLVMYRLYPNGQLWRFYDQNKNGTIGGVDLNDEGWPANPYSVSETTNGEGARLLARNVVNDVVPSATHPTPLFRYSFYDTDGSLETEQMVLGVNNRRQVVSVHIDLLVDLDPAHSPIYTEFETTAQLRNQR
jgi:prepilin-type N-terminal cleavage/methylation domain-containing protein